MNCKRFEQILHRFLAASLSAAEQGAAETHLRECFRCRQLEQIARGEAEPVVSGGQPDLTQAILERTSGGSCERTRDLACALADGELQEEERQLATLHLQHCSSCSDLVGVLAELKHTLPEMAETEPPAFFAAAVLRATTAAGQNPQDWLSRLMERLRAWVRQPRFTLEAAYLGTLLLLAILGNPAKALDRASPYLLSALQVDVQGAWEAGIRSVPPEWIRWSTGAVDEFKGVSTRLAETGSTSGRFLINLLQGDEGSWRTVLSPAADAMRSSMESVTAIVEETGRELLGGGPEKTPTPDPQK